MSHLQSTTTSLENCRVCAHAEQIISPFSPTLRLTFLTQRWTSDNCWINLLSRPGLSPLKLKSPSLSLSLMGKM